MSPKLSRSSSTTLRHASDVMRCPSVVTTPFGPVVCVCVCLCVPDRSLWPVAGLTNHFQHHHECASFPAATLTSTFWVIGGPALACVEVVSRYVPPASSLFSSFNCVRMFAVARSAVRERVLRRSAVGALPPACPSHVSPVDILLSSSPLLLADSLLTLSLPSHPLSPSSFFFSFLSTRP